MNPFLKTQIDQLNKLVNDLTRTLEEYDRQLVNAHEAKEAQLRQHWKDERKINALQETLEKIPALDEENSLLKEKNQKSLEHAKQILAYSKALSGAIQE